MNFFSGFPGDFSELSTPNAVQFLPDNDQKLVIGMDNGSVQLFDLRASFNRSEALSVYRAEGAKAPGCRRIKFSKKRFVRAECVKNNILSFELAREKRSSDSDRFHVWPFFLPWLCEKAC